MPGPPRKTVQELFAETYPKAQEDTINLLVEQLGPPPDVVSPPLKDQAAAFWKRHKTPEEEAALIQEMLGSGMKPDDIPFAVSREVYPARWTMFENLSDDPDVQAKWLDKMVAMRPAEPTVEAGAADVPPVNPLELAAPPVVGSATPVPSMTGGVPTAPPVMDGANVMGAM